MIKRLAFLLLLACSTANAQFTSGQILTAAQLNNAFSNVLSLSGGVLNGPLTVPTLTVTGVLNAPNISIPISGLSPVAANTVLANATGSSAAPTAFSMPSCSSSNSSLQWSNGTGFVCLTGVARTGNPLSQFAATTSAQLLGVISDETGSGSLVFGTSPTITTPNIVGTTTNNNANAGSVGEYQSNSTAGTSLTSSTAANATSITNLPAGDWDVSCAVTFAPAAGVTPTVLAAGINTTSATVPGSNLGGFVQLASGFPIAAAQVLETPTVRVSLASPTTTFCVAQSTFSGGTMTANGFIRARRVR
ncbi:Phage protein [Caballeronia glathei]|uniref:hypothetical protein n=1 Tax=Caballeronia glathei TaxID=60547 RepID=UPI0005026D98|nr:hypothetical protein [Caballeronia glathei]CDY79487.1 Phage protein [Caballeronia glathei]